MFPSKLSVLAAVVLVSGALAKTYEEVAPVDVSPVAKKCTVSGTRCAGAPGKPYVEYAPCCEGGEVCAADEKMGWGHFCMKPPAGYEICYADGERAIGAEGMDYVPYHPCCEGEPVKDAKKGWGEFCWKSEEFVQKYYVSYPAPVEKKETEEKTTVKYGYRYTGSYEAPTAPKPDSPGYKEEYKEYSYTPYYGVDAEDVDPTTTAEPTPEATGIEYY